MNDNPNIDRRTVVDEDGEWEAEHYMGVGVETMGMSLNSDVTFTHIDTGRKLKGRVMGIGRASDDELKAALDAAKRRAEFQGDSS